MTPARKQLEALEPLVVAATFQLLEDRQADPLSPPIHDLDKTTSLFSIAISLRRIADTLQKSPLLKLAPTPIDDLLDG